MTLGKDMAEIPMPRGVRDLLPNEALFKNELLRKVESVFKRFGYLTISTPVLESLEVLNAKGGIGEEGKKLIYEIKNEDAGLRYDHTVPLARYYAMHRNLPLPFKRYYIGNAWRKEEPQKDRYREFTQADIDILGGESVYANAEVLAAAAKALEAIGLEYIIKINDRRFVNGILESFGIKEENYAKVFRTIDKLDKIGMDEVARQLSEFLEKDQVDGIIDIISNDATNDEKLDSLEVLLKGSKEKGSIDEMRQLLGLMKSYKLKGALEADFSIVRGLDYYTGIVFEFKYIEKEYLLSVGGGGRYDKLVGIYAGNDVPAVGASLGIERIANVLGMESFPEHICANVIVIYIKDSNFPYALDVANFLRENGIDADLNIAKRNIANQFNYANMLNFKYAIVIGDEEEKEKKIKLHNLASGEEEMLSMDEAAKKLVL